jgi:hypothetical protein
VNLSEKLVKTRTEHQCWGCAKTFPAGSTMWSVAGIDGDFYRCYWCETCTKVLDGLEYWQKEDGFAMGDIIESYKEEYDRVTNQKEGVGERI